MSEILKKPYEISVWEDRLVQPEEGNSYYKEVKLAVIGSDDMTSPNRVFEPVLTQDVNQETKLEFSLAYKYFDPAVGEVVINPFVNYLINERKIKLKYDGQWYDFVIKSCEEDSESMVFSYTATDLFVQELSKVGYNITFDTELGGNQGTVIELGKKTLENTDWIVDEKDSDLLRQYVNEPLYQATTAASFSVFDVTNNIEDVAISSGENIFVFYSYVANNNGKFVQFIREVDGPSFVIDDNGVITAPNYRILEDVTFEDVEGATVIKIGDEVIAEITDMYYPNQGNRLVYGQRTTYDPVMERTVNLWRINFENEAQTVYQYTDYDYSTSDVITSYITNGSNFNIFQDGTLQGWSAVTETTLEEEGINKLQPISLVTYPQITPTSPLAKIKQLSQIQGFLELKFAGTLTTDYKNTYFNSGIMDNNATVDHIAKGQEYGFRIRMGCADEQYGELQPYDFIQNNGLRAMVAKYEMVQEEYYKDDNLYKGMYVHKIIPGGIILDFDGEFEESNSFITDGTFTEDHRAYIVDNVVQTPSIKYLYKEGEDSDEAYAWNPDEEKYVLKDEDFLNYYMTTARAQQAVSNTTLSDPSVRIGIFLYTNDSALVDKYIYVEDVQLTKCIRDANGVPVTIGNVPTATSTATDYYYLKPNSGATADEIEIYASAEALAQTIGINVDDIKPIYNTDCEKILTVEASKSNCFNILQSLCETFECWLKINVIHEDDGSILLDKNHNPYKKIAFKEYAGADNFAGFKYGINLKSVKRTLESDEFVTKLIVDPVQTEFLDVGTMSIQNADANPSGESYIFNFNYYLNKGLIPDREECNKDLDNYYQQLKQYNIAIQQKQKEKIELETAILRLESKRNVFTELIEEAQNKYAEALVDFEDLTQMSYEEYVRTHDQIVDEENEEEDEDKDNLVNNDTVVELIGKIYTYSSTINNYSGLLTNINIEYKKLRLQCYGAQEYSFTVTTNESNLETDPPIEAKTRLTLSDYIDGFHFNFLDDTGYVEYESSANDKNFEAYGEKPYEFLHVTQLPEGYRIKYRSKGKYVYVSDTDKAYFRIRKDDVTDLIRKFKLVPTEEYKAQYQGYDEQINELLNLKSNVEKEFYKKYSRYIQEGTWSSTDYVDANLYYLDALQVSNTSAQPKVSYDISVVEISEIEGLENYNFHIGEKTYMEDTEFFGWATVVLQGAEPIVEIMPAREEVIVSSIEWHLDEPEENLIKIQNYKTQFEDLFQRMNATVQSVQYTKGTYARTASILDDSGRINANLLVNSLNSISGKEYNLTSDGTILTNNEGIIIRDLTNSANLVKIVSKGIKISTDGGQEWKDVLTADGISTDVLTAGIINTQNIWLMDGDNPSFRWDKAGLSAYGFNEDNPEEAYDLKTYVRFDKYGVYGIKNDENYIASSLDDVKDKASFGLTWDGFFIKNSYTDGYVSISSDDDFQVVGTNIDKTLDVTVSHLYEQEYAVVSNIIVTPIMDIEVISVTMDSLPLDFTVQDNVITVTLPNDPTTPLNGTAQVVYTVPSNVFDLGGSGILAINKITKNGEELSDTDYTFNKDTGVLTLKDFVTTSDEIVVNYQLEHIKIGAIDFIDGAPSKYGIQVKNHDGETVFESNDDGNLTVTGTINAIDGVFNGTVYARDGEFTGTIHATDGDFSGRVNATSGLFSGQVTVGNESEKYVVIDGEKSDPLIASSDYINNPNAGWAINGSGDAIFNNISARGSIKTAVFEYSEIEAVGGAFLFRPSSTIKKASVVINNRNSVFTPTATEITNGRVERKLEDAVVIDSVKINDVDVTYIFEDQILTVLISRNTDVSVGYRSADLLVEVEKPMFRDGDWCKLSNFNENTGGVING